MRDSNSVNDLLQSDDIRGKPAQFAIDEIEPPSSVAFFVPNIERKEFVGA